MQKIEKHERQPCIDIKWEIYRLKHNTENKTRKNFVWTFLMHWNGVSITNKSLQTPWIFLNVRKRIVLRWRSIFNMVYSPFEEIRLLHNYFSQMFWGCLWNFQFFFFQVNALYLISDISWELAYSDCDRKVRFLCLMLHYEYRILWKF